MKKLLILSGKGGTGKTTTAAAFVAFSNALAVADCDVDAPNLHLAVRYGEKSEVSDFVGGKKAKINNEVCVSCGKCREYCEFSAIKESGGRMLIDDIACEGCGVCEYVCEKGAVELIDDIAGEKSLFCDERIFSTARLKMGRGNSGKLVTEVKFSLFARAKNMPLAIIDGSPGIGCPVIASVSGCDLVLVVAEPSVSGISDLKRLYNTAYKLSTSVAVCINKWDINSSKTNEIVGFCKENGIPIVGKIPFDKKIPEIINSGALITEAHCVARDSLFKAYLEVMSLLGIRLDS